TFRFWTIASLLTVLAALVNGFFFFRLNSVSLSVYAVILLAYPLGLAMATWLPDRAVGWGRFRCRLNPGPFGIREHGLIAICASASILPPYAIDIISVQRLYYNTGPNASSHVLNAGASILMLWVTQCIGFAFAGLMRRFLVDPVAMWWPKTMVSCSLLGSMHDRDGSRATQKRLRVFFGVAVVAIVWQFFPGYLAPALQSIAFVPLIAQIGSGLFSKGGGGALAVSLDWSAMVITNPLNTPLWAQMHALLPNFVFMWMVVPLLYHYNIWGARLMPLFSTSSFDVQGNPYNVSRVLDPVSHTLIEDAYTAYSPIRLTPFWAIVYATSFAALCASITHALVWYGPHLAALMPVAGDRRANASTVDPHDNQNVSLWFYLIFLVALACFGILLVERWNDALQLRWWGIIFAIILASIFVFPAGVIQAISNQKISLITVSSFIWGFIEPGKPLAVVTFKTFSAVTVTQALEMLEAMKLGQYLKIPQRAILVAQLWGTLVGSVISYFVMDLLLLKVPDITLAAQGKTPSNPSWNPITSKAFYTSSLTWGAVGSARLYGPSSPYHYLLMMMPIGAVLPIIFWWLHRRFPNRGFDYVNVPIALWNIGYTGSYGANILMSTSILSLLSQGLIKRRCRAWFDRYMYPIAAAMDISAAVSSLLIWFLLSLTR
ncbi:hypothetical protein CXG81DRAFT_3361, partial [Caulochytrium protostelioides]